MPKIIGRTDRKRMLQFGIYLLCGGVALTAVWAKRYPGSETSKGKCVTTQNAGELKKREGQLRAAAEKLWRSFRERDTRTFFSLAHPDHFGMGESKNYTLAELKEAFRTREEMYCLLFDASCIPPPAPNDTPETAFSEVAKRPNARLLSIEILSGENCSNVSGCHGEALFVWYDAGKEIGPNNSSRFVFMYEDGQWKTTGFDFPPAVRQP